MEPASPPSPVPRMIPTPGAPPPKALHRGCRLADPLHLAAAAHPGRGPKKRRAEPYHRAPLLDRDLEVVGHAHRELPPLEAIDPGRGLQHQTGPPEGIADRSLTGSERRHRHESLDAQPRQRRHPADPVQGLRLRKAALGGFSGGVDLDEHGYAPPLRLALARQPLGEPRRVHAVNQRREAGRPARLAALNVPDHVPGHAAAGKARRFPRQLPPPGSRRDREAPPPAPPPRPRPGVPWSLRRSAPPPRRGRSGQPPRRSSPVRAATAPGPRCGTLPVPPSLSRCG